MSQTQICGGKLANAWDYGQVYGLTSFWNAVSIAVAPIKAEPITDLVWIASLVQLFR